MPFFHLHPLKHQGRVWSQGWPAGAEHSRHLGHTMIRRHARRLGHKWTTGDRAAQGTGLQRRNTYVTGLHRTTGGRAATKNLTCDRAAHVTVLQQALGNMRSLCQSPFFLAHMHMPVHMHWSHCCAVPTSSLPRLLQLVKCRG